MRDFHLPGRSAVYAENGLCATSHPLAAKVAIDLLQAGGSAADAAIGAAAILGLAEPAMTGLGGDCFVLLQPAPGRPILALNGSGRAPAALDAAALRAAGHRELPLRGAASVTIPGAVDAFCDLSQRFGRLGLDQVLAPAIGYAETGIPVAPRSAADWQDAAGVLQGAARDAFLAAGRPLRAGQMFRAPGQAEVLRRIAAEGRAGFYTGEVTADMVATLRRAGGVHTAEDFAANRPDWVTPIEGGYRGRTLVEHPPNGAGATAHLLAAILECFDLSALDPAGAARAHLETEAAKLAHDARDRFLADPGHTTRLAHMRAPETAYALAGLIDPRRALPEPRRATEAIHRETSYLAVIDRDRMAVSMITSIYHDFGSGIASDRFGLLLHNRGAGFTLEPGHPNEAAGGKRPLHTILPAMLTENGALSMCFGVMGGGYQPTGQLRVLGNMLDFGQDPQTAIDGPRVFAAPGGAAGELRVERGYAPEVRQALSDLGHNVVVPQRPIGGAQAVRIRHEDGVLEGASDPRKDGCALGY